MPKIPSDNEIRDHNNNNGLLVSDVKVINNIAENLRYLATPIESLVPDPMNARTHSERNTASIMQSLEHFGQVKPIVVRKQTMVVVAGNGTLESAKRLGWTHIAANVMEMTDSQAANYGLADNRTAELAGWNLDVVAKLERLISDCGDNIIGWDNDELNVIRSRLDWIPNEPTEKLDTPNNPEDFDDVSEFVTSPDKVEFDFGDWVLVEQAIERMRELQTNDLTDGQALAIICKNWLEVNG